MNQEQLQESLEIPKGVTVTFKDYTLFVKGSKGELSRKLDTPKIKVNITKEEVSFISDNASKREKRMMNTYLAHLKNMMRGVQEAHMYTLKICSGHFPMSVSYKNNILEVKNFLGEKIPRVMKVKPNVEVKVEADIIKVSSTSKELAGQAAASMEQLTRRPGFDKRVYQDGIYITEKDGKKV
jgi:large subunit ribosomal protein L6